MRKAALKLSEDLNKLLTVILQPKYNTTAKWYAALQKLLYHQFNLSRAINLYFMQYREQI